MSELTVVICTHNPDIPLLMRVMEALDQQAEAPEFEIVLIDNNSTPPIDTTLFSGFSAPTFIAQEPRQGLAFARSCGVALASAPVICFVDDDNILEPDFLANSIQIARDNPEIGAFGGRARGVFGKRPDWLVMRHIGRYAVRDYGAEPIVGSGRTWGSWEPFGAGLVVRAEIARTFAQLVDLTEDAGGLGRNGAHIASGEDSLFSRIADRLGYKVAYRPELALDHVIKSQRLGWRYLFKLVAGQARAQVALNRICGDPDPAPPPKWREPDLAVRRFVARLRTPGLYEAITHIFWDHAYWAAQRRPETVGQQRLRAAFDKLSPANRPVDHAPLERFNRSAPDRDS